jgi:hypothetical protein
MPSVIHVSVARPFRGRQPGVVIHPAPLPADQREVRDGIPVTTIGRTLQDVATSSDPTLVRQAVIEAINRGVLSRRQLHKMVREAPELAPLVVDALTEDA